MNLIPNFKPENIVQSIENITKKGFEVVSSAEKGGNWDEVITATDNFECELGRLTSVNSHLNAVMFSDEFNLSMSKLCPLLPIFIQIFPVIKHSIQLTKT